MKANEHPSWNNEFPEQFNWYELDSVRVATLATQLSLKVKAELAMPAGSGRLHTPGLRIALREIGRFQLSPE